MQVFGPLTPGSASSQEVDFGIVREYDIKEPTLKGYVFPTPDEALIRERYEILLRHDDQFRVYGIGFSLFGRAWTLRWKRC